MASAETECRRGVGRHLHHSYADSAECLVEAGALTGAIERWHVERRARAPR